MTTRDFEEEKSASGKEDPQLRDKGLAFRDGTEAPISREKEDPRLRDKRLAFRDGTEGPISREKEGPRRVMGPRKREREVSEDGVQFSPTTSGLGQFAQFHMVVSWLRTFMTIF